LHVREDGLHRPEVREEADAEGALELRRGLPLDAPHAGPAPGVVHEHVDAAPGVERRLHRGGHLRVVADVGLHEAPLAAERGELPGGACPGLGVPLGDADLRALAREAPRDPAADPLAGAGHDRDPVRKPAHLRPSYRGRARRRWPSRSLRKRWIGGSRSVHAEASTRAGSSELRARAKPSGIWLWRLGGRVEWSTKW